ncbi:S41 family peptidase [Legionella oakridgensis]|uniref:C-terminal peptidase n=2 Tax=Legionella oakridgensis TaxID=29423 RepID=W0BHK8_9GAMM|nr:S41 family peptidase [Legionella oakridgensis]AHE67889.1 C-terminal peptidase [Legionella oakridgensis ATCC 33761 = DSM 21215]ETO92523.1 C-terminal peptidase prc [Legionella oakridgensis RV-2-2007]KTD38710.1 carboxy-terminal protease [Legionella oakridgensis]STY20895.1 carboxy-terminal protease [Legionella longbeachae]
MSKKRLYAKTVVTLLVTVMAFPTQILAAEEENEQTTQRIPMEDVQRFSNAIGQIKKYYVKPTDDKELFDNAIRGMLSGLDPHSTYLDEEDFKELQTATTGEFGGLGIEVTMEEGLVKVVTPLVDTPAYKAGIKAGDYIVKLGTQPVQGMELKDAVNLMRGKPGSTIDLTILRKGENKPLNFTLVREKILVKSVKSKLLDKKYGYIRLTQFQALTGKDMQQAIAQLQQESGGKLKGLVLDLRNNPGGLLDSAIQVSDAFINNDKKGEEEIIVYTEGRLPGSKFTAIANPGDILHNAPIVVLINNGSASASEIVAGALKDNKRAIIVGTKSFGKGSVQTVLPLDNKRGIKLTTALYYTPSGTSIQAQGITPDIVIEEVSIAKAENEDKFSGFSEADLNGHLLNGNDADHKKSNLEQATSQDEHNLIREDYQLYAALTILKGLSVAHR